MSRGQRLAVVALAAAVAVAAFVVLQPDDEPGGKQAQPAQKQARQETTKGMSSERKLARAQPPAERITVEGGRPRGGVARIAARNGETVRLVVRSDTRDEVHVHGYDLTEEVRPGKPARLRFTAKLEGVFEIELEHGKIELAQLEVRP